MKFVLVHPTARTRALEAVRTAPEGWTVTVAEPTRNLEQSALFHAICADLAKSGLEWFGKRRSPEDWKVLLISGHAAATGNGAEVIPGLEKELVAIRESTARMTKARMTSLIEYAQAFAAQHEVTT